MSVFEFIFPTGEDEGPAEVYDLFNMSFLVSDTEWYTLTLRGRLVVVLIESEKILVIDYREGRNKEIYTTMASPVRSTLAQRPSLLLTTHFTQP